MYILVSKKKISSLKVRCHPLKKVGETYNVVYFKACLNITNDLNARVQKHTK